MTTLKIRHPGLLEPALGAGELAQGPTRMDGTTSLDAAPLFPGLRIELQEI